MKQDHRLMIQCIVYDNNQLTIWSVIVYIMTKKREDDIKWDKKDIQTKHDIVAEIFNSGKPNTQAEFNEQYYHYYRKIYHTGLQISSEMKQLILVREDLWTLLSKLEESTMQFKDTIRGQTEQKKRRSRRVADQIERSFYCPNDNCGKSYGTQSSLNQHLRLKHPRQKNNKNCTSTTLANSE